MRIWPAPLPSKLLPMVIVAAFALSGCADSVDPETAVVDARPGRAAAQPADPDGRVVDPPTSSVVGDAGDGASVDDSVPSTVPFPAPSTRPTSSTSSTSPPPSSTSDVDPAPVDPPSELEAVVTELIAFVEQSRGLEFVERPNVVGLDEASFGRAFAQLVAEDAERYRSDYDNFTNIYRAMGVIDGTQTLEEIWTGFGDAGVIGFYDAVSGDIVLRGDEVNALTRTTLVHELVHALDDQIFDIEREEYDDRDDEIAWAFSALIEGNASVIEDRYRDTMTQAERDEESLLLANLPRSVPLSAFTNSFLDLQFGRYSFGQRFAEGLWADGQSAVDAAFVDPPTTSEQIIVPSTYLEPVDPSPSLPPADGVVFESGVWGQAAWAAVLGDVLGYDDAHRAAEGWSGDQFAAWQQGGITCVRAHIAADSPGELDEYAEAIEDWARRGDRDVFYPTAELIRVTSCA